jgi:uncharacterized protein (UPF0248 family)
MAPIVLIILILTLLCIGIIFLFYWVPTKFGYRKTGIILSSLISFCLLFAVLTNVYNDDLFSKNDAVDLLAHHKMVLKENFELVTNESQSGIGDYYHTFRLKISKKDKADLINRIRNSSNFKTQYEKIEDITTLTDRYTGKSISQNYETTNEFVNEIFEPLGKNMSPNHRIIKIEKSDDTLTFEDIAL